MTTYRERFDKDKALHMCMIGYGLHPPWNEGCTVVAQNLALALQNHVDIFMISVIRSIDHNFTKNKLKQSTIVTNYVKSSYTFRTLKSRGKYLLVNQMLDVPKIYSLLKSLDSKYGIDIIHIFNISHLMISMLAKAFFKKSIVAHVFGPSSVGDVLAENFIDVYACTSKTNYSCLISKGIPKQKVRVIPPIIDCNVYRPLAKSSVQKELSVSNNPFIITYIGNIFPQRMPPEIITEIQKLVNMRYDLKLLVYCPDTLLNREDAMRLKTVLSKSKIRYRVVLSNLSEMEKVLIYNISDILIFPYTREVEDVYYRSSLSNLKRKLAIVIDPPITILEAMACGKIVIASKTISIPDVIRHGENGFLFDPEDFIGFRNLLKSVIENFHELGHVRANARKTIQKNFSSDAVTNRVINVYRSILG